MAIIITAENNDITFHDKRYFYSAAFNDGFPSV